jgi:3-hydroxyisobutyrate dehydrogenase-like beta-hydroxyacid dehydrogenase
MVKSQIKNIGLIGIGLVGIRLASLLIDEGYDVYGIDIDDHQHELFLELGGIGCNNPKEVAERSEVIFLALMTPKIVEDVLFNKVTGIIAARSQTKIIINCSTIDPGTSEEFGTRLREYQVKYVECPIAGGSVQIEQKKATYLIGGEKALYSKLLPIFKPLSSQVIYTGPIGSAMKAKLIINLILGLNRAALAEGILFADILGMDRQTMLDIIHKSPADSFIARTKGSILIQEDFSPRGYLFQHAKDVSLIIKEAQNRKRSLPFSELHYQLLQAAIEHGDGELDNIAIFKELERQSKVVKS